MPNSSPLSRDGCVSTRRWERTTLTLFVCLSWVALETSSAAAFIPSLQSATGFKSEPSVDCNNGLRRLGPDSISTSSISTGICCQIHRRMMSTKLYSFMGSDGGILGIGTPELFTILLVGYFVLGPSDLYKLTKEIGKFVQNFRTFTTEATATLENSMENQLQLEEIRKAQRELTDAFSFRRSINVGEETDPFEVNAQSPRPTLEEEVASGSGTGSPKKKRVRRVKKKKNMETIPDSDELANNVPDLDMDDELSGSANRALESLQVAQDELEREEKAAMAKDAAAQTRKERKERLQRAEDKGQANGDADVAEQSRFQQQLAGDWNDQILANNDKLDPLGGIMERLAILEEEKAAADERLQEEFRLREENEERFYREKRQILEEAAAQVQAAAYSSMASSSVIGAGGETDN